MKRMGCILLLLLLPGVVLAGPVLVMHTEKITHDGWIPSGNQVQVTFSLSNSGDTDLAILKVIPDCGCSAAYFDPVIAPGCQGRIDLVIDTTGLAGRVKKRAIVRTNDPQKKGFMIEAELDVMPLDSGT